MPVHRVRLLFGVAVICVLGLLAPHAKAQECNPPNCLWAGLCYAEGATLKQSDELLHICHSGQWAIAPPNSQRQTIVVDSAQYGKGSSENDVKGRFIDLCKGNMTLTTDGETCSVLANNGDFGDPAHDLPKTLKVHCHCEKDGFQVPASDQDVSRPEGGHVVLQCPKQVQSPESPDNHLPIPGPTNQ
jgi:hypothetical protein